MPQVQNQTLVLLIRDGCLYLGRKKLKIGAGMLMPSGGKMEDIDDGDPKLTAVREVYQESGVVVAVEDLKLVALLHISREGKGHEIDLYVYMTEVFTGDLIETSEMGMLEPYRFADVDYTQMMPADRLWLPPVLGGLTIEACITYDLKREVVEFFKISPKKFD